MKTVLNNVFLPTLFIVVNNIVPHVTLDSGSTILSTNMNIVGSKTLFSPVFNNPVQVDNYLPTASSIHIFYFQLHYSQPHIQESYEQKVFGYVLIKY